MFWVLLFPIELVFHGFNADRAVELPDHTASCRVEQVWLSAHKGSNGWTTARPAKSHWTEDFQKDVIALHSEIAWTDRNDHAVQWDLQTNVIGTWMGYEVADVWDRSNAIKHIMLKRANRYQLLSSTATHSKEYPASSIATVDGIAVLSNRVRVPGTGNFFEEQYFVCNPTTLRIEELSVQQRIQSHLDRLLPEGHSVRKSGGFELSSMRFKHSVWRDDDSNCCPTGGRVEIDFAVHGAQLIIERSRYRPPDP